MKILITGVAGFIGYHLAEKLTETKKNIIYGVDNLFIDENLNYKKRRLNLLSSKKNFIFKKIDIRDIKKLKNFFKKYSFDYVINLAAIAGVRMSFENPKVYYENNIEGYMNILLLSKHFKIKHLVHASSSSVYGDSYKFPQEEINECDNQTSFYGSTKKINESMSKAFSKNFNLPITCLRFFTVYGPYSRRDMAIYKFISSAYNNKKIILNNKGNHFRDFTYIDDVISMITKIIRKKPTNKINFNIFNIGSGKSISLSNLIKLIEKKLNFKLQIKNSNFKKGDVFKTHASIKKINKFLKRKVNTISIDKGIENYIDWYKGELK